LIKRITQIAPTLSLKLKLKCNGTESKVLEEIWEKVELYFKLQKKSHFIFIEMGFLIYKKIKFRLFTRTASSIRMSYYSLNLNLYLKQLFLLSNYASTLPFLKKLLNVVKSVITCSVLQ